MATYDLAVSLEVAKHLPTQAVESFTDFLMKLSDVILLSAGISYQTGDNYVNTQWQSYWQMLFEKNNSLPIRTLRNKIWDHPEVAFFYK